MQSEHLTNLHPGWVVGGWAIAVSVTAGLYLGGVGLGLVVPGSDALLWVIASLAGSGIPAKAYLPCVHLFPHIRELGYGPGQFPVAESVSARSLALPFHSAMSESDVARVAEALGRALAA